MCIILDHHYFWLLNEKFNNQITNLGYIGHTICVFYLYHDQNLNAIIIFIILLNQIVSMNELNLKKKLWLLLSCVFILII